MPNTGRFYPYPATPESVEAVSSALLTSATSMRTVADDAVDQQMQAAGQTFGFLPPLFEPAVLRTRFQGDDLVGAAVVGSGTLRVWSHAIVDYDTGIDALNAEYAAAAPHFGVSWSPSGHPTEGVRDEHKGHTPPQDRGDTGSRGRGDGGSARPLRPRT